LTPEMSRRGFLAAVGSTAAVAAIPTAAFAALPDQERAISPLVVSSDLYASPEPQRVAFAVAVGKRYASFTDAQVAFGPPGVTEGTVVDTRLYKKGLPRGRGVYVAHATFPTPGAWNALLLTRGRRIPFAVQVKDAPEAPVIGTQAPRSPSPTAAATLGVKPICTRAPQCPLHDQPLDQLIGTGAPVAVMFATPALCQTAYCGPVLDQLLDLQDQYAERVRFHHVEIYRSNRGADVAPTVAAWGLPSEPWIYTIDGDGIIRGRLDGAFGSEEIAANLDALVR